MQYKCAFTLVAIAALSTELGAAQATGTVLSYFGRATVRITSRDGSVAYIDPYADGDYSPKADLVLVTHGHDDHNAVSLVSRKPGAQVAGAARASDAEGFRAMKEGDTFVAGAFTVRAVPSYNKNHKRASSLGFLVTVDGIVVYHAGDTSFIPEMEALADARVDYALFPADGFYNMGPAEAAKCADAVKPRFAAAIHTSRDGAYDEKNAAAFAWPGAFALKPGTSVTLSKAP